MFLFVGNGNILFDFDILMGGLLQQLSYLFRWDDQEREDYVEEDLHFLCVEYLLVLGHFQ